MPEAEPERVGENVVVVGGSAVGMEAALNLSLQGKQVRVIEMLEESPASMKLRDSAGAGASELMKLFEERNIPVYYGCALEEIEDGGILYRDLSSGEREILSCDTVLLALGMRPRQKQAEALRHCAPETSVFLVGDCEKAGSVYEAVNQAFQVSLHI